MKRGLSSLQTVLPSRPLRTVVGGMGTGRQLGHGQCADRQFIWEKGRIGGKDLEGVAEVGHPSNCGNPPEVVHVRTITSHHPDRIVAPPPIGGAKA